MPWPQEVLDEFSNTTSSSSSSSSTAVDAVAALSVPQGAAHSLHTAGSSRCNTVGGSGGGSSSPCGGPCMRMGMAEGQPHSIMPDHLVSNRQHWKKRLVPSAQLSAVYGKQAFTQHTFAAALGVI